jgi:hypothetical protein
VDVITLRTVDAVPLKVSQSEVSDTVTFAKTRYGTDALRLGYPTPIPPGLQSCTAYGMYL